MSLLTNIINLFSSKKENTTGLKDKISIDRISLLHPKLRNLVLSSLVEAESIIDQNLAIRVVQGLRTFQEQQDIYDQGRVKPGKVVTNAKPGTSFHNYGLAIDICFLFKQSDGTYKYDDEKSWLTGPNHKKVVDLLKSKGFTWGGDFKTITDKPHFEMSFGYSIKTLLNKYQNGEFIPGTKYINI